MSRLDGIAALLQRTDANLARVRGPVAPTPSQSDIALEWHAFQQQSETEKRTEQSELRAFLLLCDQKMTALQNKYDETEKSLRNQLATSCADLKRYSQPQENVEVRLLHNKVQILDAEIKENRKPDFSIEEVKRSIAQVSSRMDIMSDKFDRLQREKDREAGEGIEWRLAQLEAHHKIQGESALHDEALLIGIQRRLDHLETTVSTDQKSVERALERYDMVETRLHSEEIKNETLLQKHEALAASVRAEAQHSQTRNADIRSVHARLNEMRLETTKAHELIGEVRQETNHAHNLLDGVRVDTEEAHKLVEHVRVETSKAHELLADMHASLQENQSRTAKMEEAQADISERCDALKDHTVDMMTKLHEKTDFSPRKSGESLTEALQERIAKVESLIPNFGVQQSLVEASDDCTHKVEEIRLRLEALEQGPILNPHKDRSEDSDSGVASPCKKQDAIYERLSVLDAEMEEVKNNTARVDEIELQLGELHDLLERQGGPPGGRASVVSLLTQLEQVEERLGKAPVISSAPGSGDGMAAQVARLEEDMASLRETIELNVEIARKDVEDLSDKFRVVEGKTVLASDGDCAVEQPGGSESIAPQRMTIIPDAAKIKRMETATEEMFQQLREKLEHEATASTARHDALLRRIQAVEHGEISQPDGPGVPNSQGPTGDGGVTDSATQLWEARICSLETALGASKHCRAQVPVEQEPTDVTDIRQETGASSLSRDDRVLALESFVDANRGMADSLKALDGRFCKVESRCEEEFRKFRCDAANTDRRFAMLEDAIPEMRKVTSNLCDAVEKGSDFHAMNDKIKASCDRVSKLESEVPRLVYRLEVLGSKVPPEERLIRIQEKVGLVAQENQTFRRRMQHFQAQLERAIEHNPLETVIEDRPTTDRVRLLEEQEEHLREDLFHVERRILQVEQSLLDGSAPASTRQRKDEANPIPVPDSWRQPRQGRSDSDSEFFDRSDGDLRSADVEHKSSFHDEKMDVPDDDDDNASLSNLFSPKDRKVAEEDTRIFASTQEQRFPSQSAPRPDSTVSQGMNAQLRTSCIPLRSPRSASSGASSTAPVVVAPLLNDLSSGKATSSAAPSPLAEGVNATSIHSSCASNTKMSAEQRDGRHDGAPESSHTGSGLTPFSPGFSTRPFGKSAGTPSWADRSASQPTPGAASSSSPLSPPDALGAITSRDGLVGGGNLPTAGVSSLSYAPESASFAPSSQPSSPDDPKLLDAHASPASHLARRTERPATTDDPKLSEMHTSPATGPAKPSQSPDLLPPAGGTSAASIDSPWDESDDGADLEKTQIISRAEATAALISEIHQPTIPDYKSSTGTHTPSVLSRQSSAHGADLMGASSRNPVRISPSSSVASLGVRPRISPSGSVASLGPRPRISPSGSVASLGHHPRISPAASVASLAPPARLSPASSVASSALPRPQLSRTGSASSAVVPPPRMSATSSVASSGRRPHNHSVSSHSVHSRQAFPHEGEHYVNVDISDHATSHSHDSHDFRGEPPLSPIRPQPVSDDDDFDDDDDIEELFSRVTRPPAEHDDIFADMGL